MKTNLIMEPIMQYLAYKVTKVPAPTVKQAAKNNPKIMTAAQALAIEAAALVKKNSKKYNIFLFGLLTFVTKIFMPEIWI